MGAEVPAICDRLAKYRTSIVPATGSAAGYFNNTSSRLMRNEVLRCPNSSVTHQSQYSVALLMSSYDCGQIARGNPLSTAPGTSQPRSLCSFVAVGNSAVEKPNGGPR